MKNMGAIMDMDAKKKVIECVEKQPGITSPDVIKITGLEDHVVFKALVDGVQSGELLRGSDGQNVTYRKNAAYLGWKTPGTTVEKPVRQPTKIDLAIEYLKKHKTADDPALRRAMGIHMNHMPSQYLQGAVKSGRIIRDGKSWRLGDMLPPTAVAPHKAREALPPTKFKTAAKPLKTSFIADKVERLSAVTKLEDVTLSATNEPRFAVWSDGGIEITDGSSTIRLSPAVAQALNNMMSALGVVKAIV